MKNEKSIILSLKYQRIGSFVYYKQIDHLHVFIHFQLTDFPKYEKMNKKLTRKGAMTFGILWWQNFR